MLGDKIVIEKLRFWKQETKEKTEVPNEAAKVARYKRGNSTS